MYVSSLLLHILAVLWLAGLIRVDFQCIAPNYEVLENGHSKIIVDY